MRTNVEDNYNLLRREDPVHPAHEFCVPILHPEGIDSGFYYIVYVGREVGIFKEWFVFFLLA